MSSFHSKQSILERLAHSDSDLESIEVSSNLSEVTLIFSYQCVPESRIIVLLRGIINITISKSPDPDYEELAFFILEATLEKLDDGGESVFRKTGYEFFDKDGNMATYPDIDLYHFHMFGEVRAHIVCRSFDVLIPAKQEELAR